MSSLLLRALLTGIILVLTCGSRAQDAAKSTDPELAIQQIKKAVVFLHGTYQDSDGNNKETAGTGFLVWQPLPGISDRGLLWIVTNQHVIRQGSSEARYLRRITVRYNLKNALPSGIQYSEGTLEVMDEDGDVLWVTGTSNAVDLALHPVNFSDTAEVKSIGVDMFATKSTVRDLRINENDEIFFAGLFTGYFGVKKNYPIVRHGKLALLPEEPVPLRISPRQIVLEDVYLADVMSFGGNSGSPVFLRVAPLREEPGKTNLMVSYRYFLIGVMQGYFPEQARRETALHAPQSGQTRVGRTSGGLALEQLPALRHRRTRSGGDRVGMDAKR